MGTERLAEQAPAMIEVRCRSCGQLLFKAAAVGKIETVCPGRDCRRYQTVLLQTQ